MTKYERKELNALLRKAMLLRDKNRCLRCGKTETLQMSHIYPKGRYRKLEFDLDNVKTLCFGCHIGFWHKNPIEAKFWLDMVVPEDRLKRLRLRSQTSGDGMRNYKLLKLYLQAELKKYRRYN